MPMSEPSHPVAQSPPGGGGVRMPDIEDIQKEFAPQYLIRELLGAGGMGAVYRANQVALDRRIAIKVLPPSLWSEDVGYAARFNNEARAMARLNHPGIIGVYDCGQTPGGLLYMLLEFVDGVDVSRMIQEQGRLLPEHAVSITSHACDALGYAHGKGIIHRDIKPSNIMVDSSGIVKVADFGLAKLTAQSAGHTLTVTGGLLGTLDYMAPESLTLGAQVDHRADIYALGVTLYEMLTGRRPRGIFKMPSELVEGLDPRLDNIVQTALREDPALRYQSTMDMRVALDALHSAPIPPPAAAAGGIAGPALPTGVRPVRRLPARTVAALPRRKPGTGGLKWALAATALAVGCFYFFRYGDQAFPKSANPAVPPQAAAPSLPLPPSAPTPAGAIPTTPPDSQGRDHPALPDTVDMVRSFAPDRDGEGWWELASDAIRLAKPSPGVLRHLKFPGRFDGSYDVEVELSWTDFFNNSGITLPVQGKYIFFIVFGSAATPVGLEPWKGKYIREADYGPRSNWRLKPNRHQWIKVSVRTTQGGARILVDMNGEDAILWEGSLEDFPQVSTSGRPLQWSLPEPGILAFSSMSTGIRLHSFRAQAVPATKSFPAAAAALLNPSRAAIQSPSDGAISHGLLPVSLPLKDWRRVDMDKILPGQPGVQQLAAYLWSLPDNFQVKFPASRNLAVKVTMDWLKHGPMRGPELKLRWAQDEKSADGICYFGEPGPAGNFIAKLSPGRITAFRNTITLPGQPVIRDGAEFEMGIAAIGQHVGIYHDGRLVMHVQADDPDPCTGTFAGFTTGLAAVRVKHLAFLEFDNAGVPVHHADPVFPTVTAGPLSTQPKPANAN